MEAEEGGVAELEAKDVGAVGGGVDLGRGTPGDGSVEVVAGDGGVFGDGDATGGVSRSGLTQMQGKFPNQPLRSLEAPAFSLRQSKRFVTGSPQEPISAVCICTYRKMHMDRQP